VLAIVLTLHHRLFVRLFARAPILADVEIITMHAAALLTSRTLYNNMIYPTGGAVCACYLDTREFTRSFNALLFD